jgi:hypothetical protein
MSRDANSTKKSWTFPLHIADLRAESFKSRDSKAHTMPIVGGKTPETILDLGTRNEHREVMPAFSYLEAPTLEPIVTNLLDDIGNSGIRGLIVIATDTRDLIYILRRAKQVLPNVLLITLTSDVLFCHPAVNRDLVGTLCVSTFPHLVAEEEHLAFAMDASFGVFRAADRLIKEKHTTPSAGPAPLSWIGIVGRGGFGL